MPFNNFSNQITTDEQGTNPVICPNCGKPRRSDSP